MRIPPLRTTMVLAALSAAIVLLALAAFGAAGMDLRAVAVLGVGTVVLAALAVMAVDVHHTRRDLLRLTTELSTRIVATESSNAAVATRQRETFESALRDLGGQFEAALATSVDQTRTEVTVAYHQLAALLDLHGLFQLRAPLPATRGWAASPDVLMYLVGEVTRRRPGVIIECGSGVSSVVLGYAVQRLGAGRVIALEHDPQFAEETRMNLRTHGLHDVVEVRDAPLRPWQPAQAAHPGESYQWYDRAALADVHDVSLVFVDGPPGKLGPLARYPAVPVLLPKCAHQVCFVLDDTIRAAEQQVSARWIEENPELVAVPRSAEKGMHVITRGGLTAAPRIQPAC